jgi:hypothetical protein
MVGGVVDAVRRAGGGRGGGCGRRWGGEGVKGRGKK